MDTPITIIDGISVSQSRDLCLRAAATNSSCAFSTGLRQKQRRNEVQYFDSLLPDVAKQGKQGIFDIVCLIGIAALICFDVNQIFLPHFFG